MLRWLQKAWFASILVFATPAFACPVGFYNACVFGACACMPNSGTVIKTIPGGPEIVAQGAAPALEAWIIASRNSSHGTAQPIPLHIRQALSRWYSPQVLDNTRYKVGDNGFFNAARNVMFNADVSAVTLIDVIVFRSADDTQNNIPLWAHELYHVEQFRSWGTRDFSIRYARDSGAVEAPAYQRENEVRNASPIGPSVGLPGMPPVVVGGPTGAGVPVRYCGTPIGACSIPPAMVPMGTPCHCSSPMGPVFGSAF